MILSRNSLSIPDVKAFLNKPVPALPFRVFRLVMGLLFFFSTVRFLFLGWIEDHYIQPLFHFHYWGMQWLPVLPAVAIYLIHYLMTISALGIAFGKGWWFRASAIMFFLSFTYTELLDLTYYLNHYYFVSLVALLFCLIPNPSNRWSKTETIPHWVPLCFKALIFLIYTYAGLAKINSAWLFDAMPLKIWLPAHDTVPLLGPIFSWEWSPYLFSWFGMLYDCSIVFFLWYKPTRLVAYLAVIAFHAMVGILFQIGVFPIVMIGATLLFFDFGTTPDVKGPAGSLFHSIRGKLVGYSLVVFMAFQFLFPWRYLLYPGNLFWTEEGYRFSWRVMLMEKAGTATFYVKDTRSGRIGIVDNAEFLNPHQEKQMAMQPDMILQFAHFLGKHYEAKGVHEPEVYVEAYVTLNAQPSKLLIDPKVDLTKEKDTFAPKSWIIPY